LLADVEGLEDISSLLDPAKLENLLSRVHEKFQELCKKYSCFKVETTAAGLMAVANLAVDQPNDHASRIARLAMDMIEVSNSMYIDVEDPLRGNIPLRVAMHSGPVVADVVGHQNQRYCLFGDTITSLTALAKNSSAYQILCSETTSKLLGEQSSEINTKIHGKISHLGNGSAMVCYWVSEDTSVVNLTLARVRAKQQARALRASSKPTTTTRQAEKSVNVSIASTPGSSFVKKVQAKRTESINKVVMFDEKAKDELDNTFIDLEQNLKTRLGRDSSGSFSLQSK
jgi:class 3 adenylate cyclase